LVLDSFPGAAAAYSLRKLDNDYTGNCIVVQRDNGDTSAIGFAGNYLDTAAMKTFCGEGAGDSCRVRLWYDQSGNGRYARVDTAGRQPLIMADGIVIRESGQVAIRFGGTGATAKILRVENLSGISNNISHFSIFNVRRLVDTSSANANQFFQITTPASLSRILLQKAGSGVLVSAGRRLDADAFAFSATTTNHSGQRILQTALFNYSSASLTNFTNGSQVSQNNSFQTSGSTSATNPVLMSIGNDVSISSPWIGTAQEIIIYQSNQSSDRAAIETNINTFYSIY
jgi:hypothetical protein